MDTQPIMKAMACPAVSYMYVYWAPVRGFLEAYSAKHRPFSNVTRKPIRKERITEGPGKVMVFEFQKHCSSRNVGICGLVEGNSFRWKGQFQA